MTGASGTRRPRHAFVVSEQLQARQHALDPLPRRVADGHGGQARGLAAPLHQRERALDRARGSTPRSSSPSARSTSSAAAAPRPTRPPSAARRRPPSPPGSRSTRRKSAPCAPSAIIASAVVSLPAKTRKPSGIDAAMQRDLREIDRGLLDADDVRDLRQAQHRPRPTSPCPVRDGTFETRIGRSVASAIAEKWRTRPSGLGPAVSA